MKVFFRRIHLYLGLAAGLVIMVSCFTGAMLVFEEELQHAFHHERYYVQGKGEMLPLAMLESNLKASVPAAKFGSMKLYSDPSRTVEIAYTIEKKGPKEKEGKPKQQKKEERKPEPGKGAENNWRAFMNPYTGEVVELYRHSDSFFYTMFALHRWLLAGSTGKLITGISTMIFLFILITGIVLWWPKNKAILRQRLKIKSDAGWKRINHDWHIVTGFYSAIFLFVFSFTALAWSFEWFNKGIYQVTNSPVDTPKPPRSGLGTGEIGMDRILDEVRLRTDAVSCNFSYPKDDDAAIGVTVLPAGAGNESQTDSYHFDRHSGELLRKQSFAERSLGQRVRASFKPVHVGSVFGLPSKIIAFLSCVLGVFFPITGTIMWLNRTRKRKAA